GGSTRREDLSKNNGSDIIEQHPVVSKSNKDLHSAESTGNDTNSHPSESLKGNKIHLPSKSLDNKTMNEDLLEEMKENNSFINFDPEVKVSPKSNEEKPQHESKKIEKRAKKEKKPESESEATTVASKDNSEDLKVPLPSDALEKFRNHQAGIQQTVEMNKQKIANQKMKNKNETSPSALNSENSPSLQNPSDLSMSPPSLQNSNDASSSARLQNPGDASSSDLQNPADLSSSNPQSPKEKAAEIIASAAPSAKEGPFNQVVQLPPLRSGNDGKSASQNVQILGDTANATVSRTANSLSIEAHNIL
ncbi:hypothetical protein FO519_008796, partial [Halicephalobus sp. NKZ332]